MNDKAKLLDVSSMSAMPSSTTVRMMCFFRSTGQFALFHTSANCSPSEPDGGAASVAGSTRPWPASRTLRASADVKGVPGPWKLTVGAKVAKVSDWLDDLVLIWDLRARKIPR